MTAHKIKSIEELAAVVAANRGDGKKVVHCHGVFDLLHIGHIRYFEQARRFGDVLVVTITPDRYVDKGPHRPAFPEDLRAEAVASLDCVDFAAINLWPTAEETLRTIRPDVYVKGSEFKDIDSDMTGKIGREKAVVDEIGATLAFTEDVVFSSTNLINRHLSKFPEEINQYLDLFRSRYRLDDILAMIDRMAALKVMVVGDAIVDDYTYCNAIGKSSKDPSLVVKYESRDLFAGGALAVANHVSNFADNVHLVSVLGTANSHEEFIRTQLHANVAPHFAYQDGAPTLVKRRYIDGYSMSKLFEVYEMDDTGLAREKEAALSRYIKNRMPEFDLIIAADFGHGAISQNLRRILWENAPFLAVNTQANAGNRGFHTISRYERADYACIAEHELRLDKRVLSGNIEPCMADVARRLGCQKFVVTLGRKGCAVCDTDGGFVQVPAFAQRVVDRVGAGDALLSVTAMAAALDQPGEIIGFLGNIVGSLAVEVMGNKKAIDRASVQKYIVSMMK